MRKQFAKTMIEIGEADKNAALLIGDISHFLLKEYEEKYTNRFYNLGICEQSLIGIAAGMSLSGMRPVVHTIAPFCVERAFEQIKIDLCYQNTDVTIISVGSSFDYAHLGCTHHCYSDISILRTLPNIDIFAPGNSLEFDQLFKKTWGNGRPKYFKLSNKEHKFNFNVEPYEFKIIEKTKSEKVLFVSGHLLDEVVEANDGKNTIIYLSSFSNITKESKKEIIEITKNKTCFSIEENSEIGALSDLIFDIMSKNNQTINLKKIGIPNRFLTSYGKPEEHREVLGLTAKKIRKIIDE